jgi:hypothetical protein
MVGTPTQWSSGHFTALDLCKVIHKLKNNKSPGPDGIPNELFKHMDSALITEFLKLINEIWDTEGIPEHFDTSYLVAIYKSKSPLQPSNYRPISLLNVIYKIFAALLRDRIMDAIGEHLPEQQFAYQKGKSTVEPLFAALRILEAGFASKSPQSLLFLDWKQAFDKLTH